MLANVKDERAAMSNSDEMIHSDMFMANSDIFTPRSRPHEISTVLRIPIHQISSDDSTVETTVPELTNAIYKNIEASLTQRIDTLFTERANRIFKDLFETKFEMLDRKIDLLLSKNDHPGYAPSSSQPSLSSGSVQDPEAQYATICSVLQQVPLLEQKSRYAVIERMPEKESEEDDERSIQQMVEDTTQEIGDIKAIRVFRHGPRRERHGSAGNYKRSRIIKVEFKDKDQRDKFIVSFRRSIPSSVKNVRPTVFARRDMVPAELELQSALRQKCYKMNREAGEMRYYYRDLKIYSCKPGVDGSFRKFETQPPGLVTRR